MVENQFNKNVKMVRSNNGREFTSGTMQEFYLNNGILLETSYINTPPKKQAS